MLKKYMPPHIEGETSYREFTEIELQNKIVLQEQLMLRYGFNPRLEIGWANWVGEVVCGSLARTDVLTYLLNREDFKSRLAEGVTLDFVEEVFQAMNAFIEKHKEDIQSRAA